MERHDPSGAGGAPDLSLVPRVQDPPSWAVGGQEKAEMATEMAGDAEMHCADRKDKERKR